MNSISSFSRRQFLTDASCFTALSAFAGTFPFASPVRSFPQEQRSQTLIVDEGYAAIYKIADGLYATISNPAKGFTTICNGGFLVGKEAGLLLESYGTPVGARFQMDVFHNVTQIAAAGALLTHYHFDHSFGSSFYGSNAIQLWGHSGVSRRLMDSYVAIQGTDRTAVLAPYQKRLDDAKSPLVQQHALGNLAFFGNIFDMANKTAVTFPNRPLDPAKLPLQMDLGHLPISIEHYPGHSGTDLIVRAPEQKVVYTGDLLFNNAYPACFDPQCTMSGWRNTLKTFASWEKDTLFVPGHGPVCGQEGIQTLSNIFDDLAEQAEKMHKAGVPLSDAIDQYEIPGEWREFSTIPWDLRIGPAISKLYTEMGAH